MWLINTTTMSLELFHGNETPEYAILSHTWGPDELSFQEFRRDANETSRSGSGSGSGNRSRSRSRSRAGYEKIVATCQRARADGCGYAWVDTCCIDKTSSAELTEAINSMFGWYRSSRICYAFLSDLAIDADADASSSKSSPSPSAVQKSLGGCRWFTRGWCLQELLAPRDIRFFNRGWRDIGTRDTLGKTIAAITGIPEAVLVTPATPQGGRRRRRRKDIHDLPLARRISWMAKRQTTRAEDTSYALLGVLGVSMPMLYGEGGRLAFQRLQEEVIRKCNDMSVFAWTGLPRDSEYMPVLASSPADFARDVAHDEYDEDEDEDEDDEDTSRDLGDKLRTQFSLTNQGIYFPSARIYCQNGTGNYRYHYLLALNYRDPCFRGIRNKDWYIALQKVGPGLFVRIHETTERHQAFRHSSGGGGSFLDPLNETVCILNNLSASLNRRLLLWERHAVRLRWKPWKKSGLKYWNIRATEPRANWDLIGGQFLVEMASEQYMHVVFVPGSYESNPRFEYFVLVMRIGGADGKDASRLSVRNVNSDIWPGVNETPFQFASKESLALAALPSKSWPDDSPEGISMLGYHMWLSVQLVTQKNGTPYHLVYIDWKEKSTRFCGIEKK